jgi:hypothetical protein
VSVWRSARNFPQFTPIIADAGGIGFFLRPVLILPFIAWLLSRRWSAIGYFPLGARLSRVMYSYEYAHRGIRPPYVHVNAYVHVGRVCRLRMLEAWLLRYTPVCHVVTSRVQCATT